VRETELCSAWTGEALTRLRCSLWLSLRLPLDLSTEQVAEQQHASVSVALQQTERVLA